MVSAIASIFCPKGILHPKIMLQLKVASLQNFLLCVVWLWLQTSSSVSVMQTRCYALGICRYKARRYALCDHIVVWKKKKSLMLCQVEMLSLLETGLVYIQNLITFDDLPHFGQWDIWPKHTIIQIIKNIWMIIFAQIVRRYMHAAPDHQFSHAQSGACPWSRRYEGLTHRHIPYPSFHTRSSWEVKCFHVKIWSTAWYDFMVRAW